MCTATPSAQAQLYVPQDKKETSRPRIFDWFRKKPQAKSVVIKPKSQNQTQNDDIMPMVDMPGSSYVFKKQPPIDYPDFSELQPQQVVVSTTPQKKCSAKEKRILQSFKTFDEINARNIAARARGKPLKATQSKSYKELETFINDPKGLEYLALLLKKCGPPT